MDRTVSADIVAQEVVAAGRLNETYAWRLSFEPATLVLRATLTGPDGEEFILEGQFDDYREAPPLLDFIDPDTGERGALAAYPRANGGADSAIFIEANGRPIICLPCSRLAYNHLGGPHAWNYAAWDQTPPRYPTVAAMLLRIQTELSQRKGYQGRWAQRTGADSV